MTTNTPNKEQVYDEQIGPLMQQIIDLCQQHGIAMLATFALPTEAQPDLNCTTAIPNETGKYPSVMGEMLGMLISNSDGLEAQARKVQ